MATDTDAAKATKIKTAQTFKKGNTPEDVMASYDTWAENYDEMISQGFFNAPVLTLEAVLRYVPKESRASTRVIDIAAGTGWLGTKMHEEGFRHMDALEPSKGMMEKLRAKGVYTKEYLEPIGYGTCSIPPKTYDLLVCSGGWGEGHIPVSGLDEFAQITKKGGLVIIVMHSDFMKDTENYKNKLEPRMEELEKKGAWTKVERRVLPNYFFDKDGVLFVFRAA